MMFYIENSMFHLVYLRVVRTIEHQPFSSFICICCLWWGVTQRGRIICSHHVSLAEWLF